MASPLKRPFYRTKKPGGDIWKWCVFLGRPGSITPNTRWSWYPGRHNPIRYLPLQDCRSECACRHCSLLHICVILNMNARIFPLLSKSFSRLVPGSNNYLLRRLLRQRWLWAVTVMCGHVLALFLLCEWLCFPTFHYSPCRTRFFVHLVKLQEPSILQVSRGCNDSFMLYCFLRFDIPGGMFCKHVIQTGFPITAGHRWYISLRKVLCQLS